MSSIKNIVKHENMSISQDQSLRAAVEKMYQNGEGAVVVVDDARVVGILTERDVVSLLDEQVSLELPVVGIAKKRIVSINYSRSTEYALHILIDNNIRRVVVVDDKGLFFGIVTQEMIINHLEGDHYRVNLKVSQVLSASARSIVTLPLQSCLEDAITKMHGKGIGSLLVVNSDEIAGIITERDLVRVISDHVPLSTLLEEIMSKPVVTVGIDDSVHSIVEIMNKKRIRRVLVLDVGGEPVGVIGNRDIIRNIKGNYALFIEKKLKHTKEAFSTINEAILELYNDSDHEIVEWGNEAALNAFGRKIMGKPITTLIDPELWSLFLNKLKEKNKVVDYKMRINKSVYLLTCMQNGGSLLLICKDVTEYEKRLQQGKDALRKQSEISQLLQNVMDQQQNIIIVTNGRRIIQANKVLCTFFQLGSTEEFSEQYNCICDLFIAHKEYFHLGRVGNGESWIEALSNIGEQQPIVSMIEQKSGEPKVFAVQVNRLDESSDFYVATFTDVTSLQIKSQENYHRATHDELTSIYNRAFFSDNLHHEMEMMRRYKSPLSLIMLDIDHFKKINDTYGHYAGDEVLKQLAASVSVILRKSDTFARWGGEEFVILLPSTTRIQAELIGENLRRQIEQLAFRDVDRVTASFGIVELLKDEEAKSLLVRADEALYEAKVNGRNIVVSR